MNDRSPRHQQVIASRTPTRYLPTPSQQSHQVNTVRVSPTTSAQNKKNEKKKTEKREQMSPFQRVQTTKWLIQCQWKMQTMHRGRRKKSACADEALIPPSCSHALSTDWTSGVSQCNFLMKTRRDTKTVGNSGWPCRQARSQEWSLPHITEAAERWGYVINKCSAAVHVKNIIV